MDLDNLKVVCTDTGKVYNSVFDASWEMQVFVTDILDCCDRKKSNTFGTHWKYHKD